MLIIGALCRDVYMSNAQQSFLWLGFLYLKCMIIVNV